MNKSYGIARGSMPHGRCAASMTSRFPFPDGGNADTLVSATWDGRGIVFAPPVVGGHTVTLETWEAHATPQGKAFAQKIRAGYVPTFEE
jgi:hypothetical protein